MNTEIKSSNLRMKSYGALLLLLLTFNSSLFTAAADAASTNHTVIQFYRGLEANRTNTALQIGEPLFTTDGKKLFMGDGVTNGGIGVAMDTDVSAASSNVIATITVWVNDRGFITGITSNMVAAVFGTPMYPSAFTSNSIVGLIGQPFYASQFAGQFNSLFTSNSIVGLIGQPFYASQLPAMVTGVVAGANVSVGVTNGVLYVSATGGGGGGGDVFQSGTNDFTGPVTFANSVLLKNGQPIATLSDIYEIAFGSLANLRPTNTALPTITGSITNGATVTVSYGTFYSIRESNYQTNQCWVWVDDSYTNGAGYYVSIGTNSPVVLSGVTTNSVLYVGAAMTNLFGMGSAVSIGYTVTNAVAGGVPETPSAATHVERFLSTDNGYWICRVLMPAMPAGGAAMYAYFLADETVSEPSVTPEENYNWTGISLTNLAFSVKVRATNDYGNSSWSTTTELTAPAAIGANVRIASYNEALFDTSLGETSAETAWAGDGFAIEGTVCWWSGGGVYSINGATGGPHYFDQNLNKLEIHYVNATTGDQILWIGYRTNGGLGAYTRSGGESSTPPTLTIEEYTP